MCPEHKKQSKVGKRASCKNFNRTIFTRFSIRKMNEILEFMFFFRKLDSGEKCAKIFHG